VQRHDKLIAEGVAVLFEVRVGLLVVVVEQEGRVEVEELLIVQGESFAGFPALLPRSSGRD
jgi:hypothetical protein